MAKFLLWSTQGMGLGIADRLVQEGHTVSIYIHKEGFKKQYDGIIKKVKHYTDALDKETIIIFDMVGYGEIADRLKKTGHKVIGAGGFNDKIELDRKEGLSLMQDVDIDIGKVKHFRRVEEGISFLQKSEERWVFKPLDNMSTSLTYSAPDSDHLVMYLKYLLERKIIPSRMRFVLQEYFDGVEISTELWFSGGNPLWSLLNHTIEVKRTMAGDLGALSGGSSSTVWKTSQGNLIVDNLFNKHLLRVLEKEEYTGPLDINSIVFEDTIEPYGLEFTPRFGYSALYALFELFEDNFGDFLVELVEGKDSSPSLRAGFGHSVSVSIPPHPWTHPDEKISRELYSRTLGLPVGVVPDSNHIWLLDVMRNDDFEFVAAGSDGLIMEVSGYGKTIEAAKEATEKILDKLTLPDRQYRIDSADRALEDYPKIKKLEDQEDATTE